MAKPLFLLHFMLTLIGYRMHSKMFGVRKLGNVYNWTMRCILIASSVWLAKQNIQSIVRKGRLTPRNIMNFVMQIITIAAIIVYGQRLERIKRLLRSMIVRKSCVDRVRTLSLVSLIVCMVVMVTELVVSVLVELEESDDYWSAVWRIMLEFPDHVNVFHVIYPAWYLVSLTVITDYEVLRLQSIQEGVRMEGAAAVDKSLRLRDTVMHVKQEFECLFNIIPFIMFAIPFTTIPEMVNSVRKEIARGGASNAAFDLAFYVNIHASLFIMMMLLVNCVNRCKEQVDQTSDAVIRCLQSQSLKAPQPCIHLLIEQLRQDQGFSYTGWRMFTIDRCLPLAFLSSLVSMSVLVVQLFNAS